MGYQMPNSVLDIKTLNWLLLFGGLDVVSRVEFDIMNMRVGRCSV